MKKIANSLLALMSLLIISCGQDDEPVATQKPSAFTVTVPEDKITDNSAEINWTQSTDPDGTKVVYNVEVNGNNLTSNLTATAIKVENLEAKTTYSIKVIATDENDEKTESTATFTTKEAPETAPSMVTITVSEVTFESAKAVWTASVDPDGTAVVYDVFVNNNKVAADLTELNTTLTNLTETTQYEVKVVAKDKDDETSTSTASFTTLEAPITTPSDVTITIEDITFESAKATWTASVDPDGTNVVYDVYLDDQMVASDLTELTTTFTGLMELTDYDVKVIAKDEDSETSESTQTFSTIKDPNQPPGEFTLSVANITRTSARIEWTEAVDPEGGNVFYDIYLNGNEEFTGITSSSWILTALSSNTEYDVKVVARDTKGADREETITFKTEPEPSDFTFTEVRIFDSFEIGGTTFDPTIRTKEVSGFLSVSSLMLNIGGKSYSITGTSGNDIVVKISQSDYDALVAATDKTGSYTLKDDNDGVNKEIEFTYVVN